MREIKFRGRRISDGEWMVGDLVSETNGNLEVQRTFIHLRLSPVGFTRDSLASKLVLYEVDPETVGQYIGLKDSNKKEICEGDVIKITNDTNYTNLPHYIGVVKYQSEQDYPAFDLRPWIDCEMNALSWLKSESDESVISYEVIGNAWDNPELLEGQ